MAMSEAPTERRVAEGANRPRHRSPEGDQAIDEESDVALQGRRALEVELA